MHIDSDFEILTGFRPLSWQRRLYQAHFAQGEIPSALDIPTGLGKTSVMALWLIARGRGARLPRRLIYVVDRRAVVDQATREAEKLREALGGEAAKPLRDGLGLANGRELPISTLRGQFVDNRAWLESPASPAIVVGTVDMIGSRLLFEGYGVSRRMRPYHAGLLGVDGLVVLDEAHLVPPFAHLLRSIERDAPLRPGGAAERELLPLFVLLPLSATLRESPDATIGPEAATKVLKPFRLAASDAADGVVKKRLGARKRLELREFAAGDPNGQLARAAWELATKNGPARVAIFCDRRDNDKSDEGAGPSVMGVREQIEKFIRAEKKNVQPPALLVGGRRVHEREQAATALEKLGFIGEKTEPEAPAFLVATSAGEVGVDLDADHMVCDLVAFERMAQRLGRVNRRGERDRAEAIVFWKEPAQPKKPNELTAQEGRARVAFNVKAVFEKLPEFEGGRDASPGALSALSEEARANDALRDLIAAARSPEPLRPPLTRALVDAWSMTSLEKHTGRPEVAPWLRGWEEDDQPRTTVVWRNYLPVRLKGVDATRDEIASFFDAARPHQTEMLESEAFRVVPWLTGRASTAEREKQIEKAEIVAFALEPDGRLRDSYRLADLLQEADEKKRKDRLEAELGGATLVVDARLRGLKDGLLDDKASEDARSADDGQEWPADVGFRIRKSDEPLPADGKDWRESFRFDIERSDDDESLSIVIEGLNEERRAESRNPQLLDEHHAWTSQRAESVARSIGLAEEYEKALVLAARLHDSGKAATCWQRAFSAPDGKNYAKTKGPFRGAVLDGYRHEFGSLPYVEKDGEFQSLPDDLKDLVLHLVAAHHGGARPIIETRGCEDAPPSMLEERARDVALRFARLQRQWGPWGLAWWEALLRAADQQASRANDERKGEKAEAGDGGK